MPLECMRESNIQLNTSKYFEELKQKAKEKRVLNSKENCINKIKITIWYLVLVKIYNRNKLQKPYVDPFEVLDVTNTNVKLENNSKI